MKHKFIIFCLFTHLSFITIINAQSNVAINASGNPDVSAILDISSGTKGLLIPRVTPAQFTTLSGAALVPANGLMVYNTTTNALTINTGTTNTPLFYSLLSSNISAPLIYTVGTSNGTASDALSMQAATSLLPGYLTTTQYGIFSGKQDYLKNTTTASLGFVQVTTTAGGVSTPSYDQTLNYNISTGAAGYYPKYTATNSLGNSSIYDDGTQIGIATSTPNSTLQVNGSFATAISSIGTTTPLNLNINYNTILASPAAGTTTTINLPDASTCSGRIYTIKLLTTGTIYITSLPNASTYQYIDNLYYYKNSSTNNKYNISTQYYSTTLQSYNSGWFIIGSATK